MRIVWMGAGEIGLSSLRWLIDESGHKVVGVFTQPDRPVGRKQVLTPTEIKILAVEQGVHVFQPESLRNNQNALGDLQQLDPDLIVVMAYGCLLPQEVIDAPSIACINLHASLLPRHRGAAPIQAAILAGDDETGITVMHITQKLDAGDMILKETIKIGAEETSDSLHDRLAELGSKALAASLPLLENGTAVREEQDEALMTHTGKLSRSDGRIDWSRSAIEIERQVRAFDPWPGTDTLVTFFRWQRLSIENISACECSSCSFQQIHIRNRVGKSGSLRSRLASGNWRWCPETASGAVGRTLSHGYIRFLAGSANSTWNLPWGGIRGLSDPACFL